MPQPPSVSVPVALLLDPHLPPAAKLVWIACRLVPHSPAERPSLRALGRTAGLDKSTIRRALPELDAYPDPAPESRVLLPVDLLALACLGIQARLLYGLLQLSPGFVHPAGSTTYSALRRLAGTDVKTVRRALCQLAEAGWVVAQQANQNRPIQFELRDPVVDRGAKELRLVKQRLAMGEFRGETLMREYLSLLIDSVQFEDDAAPGFLVNPLTNYRLQFDRYYPPRVAFEFQGPQHYFATKDCPEPAVEQQRARDLIKRGICQEAGIELILVHARDLSLRKMQATVGALLPLRQLRGLESVVAHLEQVSRKYRRSPRVHAPNRRVRPSLGEAG